MTPTVERVPNRWLMLAVGMYGQLAASVFVHAAPFLIPVLYLDRGLTLFQAGVIAAAPLVGMTLTLIAWGILVDRIGERTSMALGLTVVTIGGACAAMSTSYVAIGCWLLIGGMGAGSVSSSSGRLVVGWFPAHRRGFAMGIRQMAQPLGVGFAALSVPVVAESSGLRPAIFVPTAFCLAATVLTMILIVDPPRPPRAEAADLGHLENPYRRDRRLVRIHVSSMLLVIPQFTIWTYSLVWLIDEKGWSSAGAGAMIAVIQLLGALARVAAGYWSDRAGSRLGPIRIVAGAAALSMLTLGLLEGTQLAVAVLVVASVITVTDNGLAFTSVAEIGGPYWSGRTMGTQLTGQHLVAAAVPPLAGAAIAGAGYGLAFAAVAIFPLLAIGTVPVRGEARRRTG